MRPLDILLVEDSPDQVELTREALRISGAPHVLQVVRDGVEALDFLRQGHRPHLVLLDLNLPRMDGREVLSVLKRDPELRMLPVVVMTTSGAEEDVRIAYDLHANSYVCKPLDFESFVEVIRLLVQFWTDVARLPFIDFSKPRPSLPGEGNPEPEVSP